MIPPQTLQIAALSLLSSRIAEGGDPAQQGDGGMSRMRPNHAPSDRFAATSPAMRGRWNWDERVKSEMQTKGRV
jgi:hypothetical protein